MEHFDLLEHVSRVLTGMGLTAGGSLAFYAFTTYMKKFLVVTAVFGKETATRIVEAIGHGRQRGVTHEYRGRVFESRFLPKALLTFVVDDSLAPAVVAAVADAAQSGNESGDGLVWTSRVDNVVHHRTGRRLEQVEV